MPGILGFLVLTLLPGSWVTFGLPLTAMPFWARFLVGCTLSPVIVALQFYAARVLGVSFDRTDAGRAWSGG